MAQVTPVPQSTQPAPTAKPAAPVKETPPPVAEKPVETSEKPVKEKGKMKWLYIVVIIMAVISLALVSYIVYTEIFKEGEAVTTDQDDDDIEDHDTDTDVDVEDVEDSSETEDFTGDYVGAELPVGWDISEYSDGDGTDMVADGVDFTGLTGLEVLNGDSDMIFKFYAVYGIGGVDSCDEYYQFEDYSEDDYNDVVASSLGFGTDTELIDYTDVEYTEFTFLGLRIRRVEKMLFQDIVDGETYFEPACNISYGVWNLEDLAFNDGDMDSSAYMWEIADDATEEELLLLDDILASMEVI
jgi:hypothetical protein